MSKCSKCKGSGHIAKFGHVNAGVCYECQGTGQAKAKDGFPNRFPFWARMKIDKQRTTLVIDEAEALDKRNRKPVDGFVHREATHSPRKDYESVNPNPDKDDPKPMYLKRPKKTPKHLVKPHGKKLDMPKNLKDRYDKPRKKK